MNQAVSSSRKFVTKAILSPLLGILVASCASESRVQSTVDQPLVEDKYRLTADREALAKMREDIPAGQQVENDETAFGLQMMVEGKRPPNEIREKFNSTVSKKRATFQKDLEKRREEFVRKERTDRETFQRAQESERKVFNQRKAKADERKAFYDESDRKRRDFYSDQREQRDAFEADIRDRRKNFDDYIRGKTAEFNQEHRAYVKRIDDQKKETERLKKLGQSPATAVRPVNSSPIVDPESGFGAGDQKPSTPLGTEE